MKKIFFPVFLLLTAIAVSAQNWRTNGNNIGATDYLGGTNAQNLNFRTSATERMRIAADGKVSIGVPPPGLTGGLLTIWGDPSTNDASAGGTGGFLVLGNTNAPNLALDNNEIMARDGAGAATTLNLQADGGPITIHGGSPGGIPIPENQRIYITPGGSMGIGINPTYNFQVANSTSSRSAYFTNSFVNNSGSIYAIAAETNNGGTGDEYCGSFSAKGVGGKNYGIYGTGEGGSTNVGVRSHVDGSGISSSFNYGLNVSMIPSTSSINYGVYVDIDDLPGNPASNHFSGYFKNGKVFVGDRLGIGTAAPAASAALDIQSDDKGILVPRLSAAQRTAIASPATGLVVYDNSLQNFFFYNGSAWTPLLSGSNDDADADPGNEFNSGAALIGTSLQISDGGGTLAVDLSDLVVSETDPEIGGNTTNYLPKWDGSALVQSASVFEDASGNVGIGATTVPVGYKLAVNGKVIATELKVQSTPWPDYVFEKDYPLLSLADLETFVQQNGHLPGIPGQAEVAANAGVEIGDMQRRMLEKLEEMTLYIFQLKKENDGLKQRLERLEK